MAWPAAGEGGGEEDIGGDTSRRATEGESRRADSGVRLELAPDLLQSIGGGSGRRSEFGFGLGLLFFSDQQSSLKNSFSQSTVSLLDPASGTASTTVLEGDPELNNRKFDFELNLQGTGIFVPIEWTHRNGGRTAALYLGAAEIDVDFDVLGTTEGSALSSSFSGRGPTYLVGLEATACVAGSCKWSSGFGYRYWHLPSLDVARAIPISGPAIEVLEGGVTLSRRTHELSTRVWHGIDTETWSYRPYTGVLYRSTEVEIIDSIRFRDGLDLETAQRTVSRYESDGVLALFGVQAELASLSGSLETFVGSGDHGVRFQFAWKPRYGPIRDAGPTPEASLLEVEGPKLEEYTARQVVIKGAVKRGWPVVVEYKLEQDGFVLLTIKSEQGKEFKYKLRGKKGVARHRIRKLPKKLGLEAGTLTIQAFPRRSRVPVEFEFLGIGVGAGAIASIAVEITKLEPLTISAIRKEEQGAPGGEYVEYEFVSLNEFPAGQVEFYKKEYIPKINYRAKKLAWSWCIRNILNIPIASIAAPSPAEEDEIEGATPPRASRYCSLEKDALCGGRWHGQIGELDCLGRSGKRSTGEVSQGTHIMVIKVWGGDRWIFYPSKKTIEVIEGGASDTVVDGIHGEGAV